MRTRAVVRAASRSHLRRSVRELCFQASEVTYVTVSTGHIRRAA
jgi:hypothetical protein